jgi:hypothetical protein
MAATLPADSYRLKFILFFIFSFAFLAFSEKIHLHFETHGDGALKTFLPPKNFSYSSM